jgi:hypothetical protein
MPAAIYALFDIILEMPTGSVIYMMKHTLVFYICKTKSKKLLNIEG